MALVKLSIVAIFLCFTFTKIVPTIAGEREDQNQLMRLSQDNSKWYVVAKTIESGYPLPYPSTDFDCTTQNIKFSLDDGHLMLKIGNQIFSCRSSPSDSHLKTWYCTLPFPSKHNADYALVKLSNSGDIEIVDAHGKESYMDHISLPGKWSESHFKKAMGDRYQPRTIITKNTNC